MTNIEKNELVYVDTITSMESYKIYRKSSMHYGKILWRVKCKENEFKVAIEHLEDKSLIEDIEDKLIIGKEYRFTILKSGKYLVEAELTE